MTFCFNLLQKNSVDIWFKGLGESWRTTYGLLFFNTKSSLNMSVTVNMVQLGAEMTLGYGLNEAFDSSKDIFHIGADEDHVFTVDSGGVLLYYVFPNK